MKNNKKPKNFEDALNELEKLSEMIQNDSTKLEQMVEIFERGTYLSKYCKNKLEDIDEKISLLVKENNIIEEKEIS
ncbi:MAG: exodeoxyribonuclease VII small subunit [Candidatus Marinimicrobia bacterium]|nr:exodeoxyribonuclease VII small subunit [Candidatus Neomarinimicrobiota bacterium]|tara:strand:- start:36404 stop:36631 length:228 start_codon:yes stop_codon:yes gene_type:complete